MNQNSKLSRKRIKETETSDNYQKCLNQMTNQISGHKNSSAEAIDNTITQFLSQSHK